MTVTHYVASIADPGNFFLPDLFVPGAPDGNSSESTGDFTAGGETLTVAFAPFSSPPSATYVGCSLRVWCQATVSGFTLSASRDAGDFFVLEPVPDSPGLFV